MTLAEIRTAVRTYLNEEDTDAGALFPAGSAKLDFFINDAVEMVSLDLVEFMPTDFLDYETIDLVSGVEKYRLSREWMRIDEIKRNTTGESPTIIPYFNSLDEMLFAIKDETGEPRGWTLVNEWIYFRPTPDADYDGWARAYIQIPEQESMALTGPQKLHRMAQKLIPLAAMVLIAHSLESKASARWEKLYAYRLARITRVLGMKVQQQPRFLGAPFGIRSISDERDPNFYDTSGFFD